MRQWITAMLAVVVIASHAGADKKNELPELTVTDSFAPDQTMRAEYGFYWNGIRVSTAEALAALSDENYDIAFNFRMRGLATIFSSGRAHVRSTGTLAGSSEGGVGTVPNRYYSMGRWDGKNYTQTMLFNENGALVDQQLDWPEKWLKEFKREPVPEEMKVGPDPMSVVLELIRTPLAAAQNGQSAGGRIFDGDSVFDMRLNCLTDSVELEESSRTPYSGQAYECMVDGDLVAGKRILTEKQKKKADKARKKREKKKAKGKEDKPPRMWVQPFENGQFLLPVRAEIDTGFGRVVMYLQNLDVDRISDQTKGADVASATPTSGQ